MAIRKDGMEKWSVENGIFIVCPIEYLAEKLGMEEEEIEAKLGHVYGLLTMEPYSVVKVEKSYHVEKDGDIHPTIQLTTEKTIMHDHIVKPVRYLEDDELLLDETFATKKLNNKDHLALMNEVTKITEEHQKMIIKRTNEIINKK